MNLISLKFMIEKREGHGEDSNPLFLVKDNTCAVGVFDGMGGSGAATCMSEFGEGHTKAYVASRIIQEAISNYIRNINCFSDINAEGIWSTAKSRLEQEKSIFPTKVSGLRSKLVREYPTTLAIVTSESYEDGTSTINSYWAGDSRNYLWNSDGFFQISKDDLDTELDPLENLRNDGALSNCVCADRNFQINNKRISVKGNFVIISATDGCFGYFPTPMHFHEVLLTGLKLSEDEDEWSNFVKEEICKVTGDDVCLSLCAIGYEDFCSLKASFENDVIEGFDELNSLQNEILNLEISIEKKKQSLEEVIQTGWKNYKTNYMKYIDFPSSMEVKESIEETNCVDEQAKSLEKDKIKNNNSEEEIVEPTIEPTVEKEAIESTEEKGTICKTEVDSVCETTDSIHDYEEIEKEVSSGPLINKVEGCVVKQHETYDEAPPIETMEPIDETVRTEDQITKEEVPVIESGSKDTKLEEERAHSSYEDKTEIITERIIAHTTTFPKRVGVAQPKSGLRFGSKEPKNSLNAHPSGIDEKNKEIQELLIAFERNPSMETAKQIMISFCSFDEMPTLPKEVKERIAQFLNRL